VSSLGSRTFHRPSRPTSTRPSKRHARARPGPADEDLSAARRDLEIVDRQLRDGPFLLGHELFLCDLFLAPIIGFAQAHAAAPRLFRSLGGIQSWHDRIASRSSFCADPAMNDDTTMPQQHELALRAAAGAHSAFEALLLICRPALRGVIRRMVGHPDDTEELVQEAVLHAWESIATFRGEASFGTWLCAIGIRQALDHLRRQKAWRAEAQVVYLNECFKSEALQSEVLAVFADPAFAYEAREHIAYCFNCVGRSLEPEQQAVLVMREVLGLSAREAARALGITESVMHHHLAAARSEMSERFEGLCALVNKGGVCYQCKGLREATPQERQGGPIPPVPTLDARLDVVRGADVDHGASQMLHDLFWRRTKELEDSGRGSPTAETDCGRD
jgi:RNA polymerase sigma-70 factor, ECF subfamily